MPKLKHLLISLIASASLFVIFSSSTHAASFTVAAGNDENTDNSSCALTEAIENINDQATTNTDCAPTGAYGTDDTINLPAGTITLTADLPEITEEVSIEGQGMGVSVIDGDSAYGTIAVNGVNNPITTFNASGFTVTGFQDLGMQIVGLNIDVQIDRIEIDGTGIVYGSFPTLAGIVNSTNGQTSISNVYIHDISSTTNGVGALGIGFAAQQGVVTDVDISNSTITNISAAAGTGAAQGIAFQVGVLDGSATPGTITAQLSNNTVSNLNSEAANASAISTFGTIDGGESNIDIVADNNTIAHIHGVSQNAADSASLFFVAGAANNDDVFNVNYQATNNIYMDSTSDGVTNNTCTTIDINSFLPGTGTNNFNLTSTGGNLSDDDSCSSYFTDPTDQNNVSGLGSTLSALADNGGFVPTMALKQNSPAIDSGITIPTLTTDARGAIRPQGNAYDSGAYESPYTRSEDEADSSTDSLASTGQNIRLAGIFAAILLALGLMLHLRRQYV